MFEDEMGFNQAKLAADPLTARGIELWIERVLGFYGGSPEDPAPGGVDVQVIPGQARGRSSRRRPPRPSRTVCPTRRRPWPSCAGAATTATGA